MSDGVVVDVRQAVDGGRSVGDLLEGTIIHWEAEGTGVVGEKEGIKGSK